MLEMPNNVRTFAIFDVDETLIQVKSMFSFMEFALIERFGVERGQAEFEHCRNRLLRLRDVRSREDVNRDFYRQFRGWRLVEFRSLAEKWFEKILSERLFYRPVLEKLRSHQAAGHQVVFLSGSAEMILQPLADYLDVSHLLAVRLSTDAQGKLTGEIKGIQTIGEGKKAALVKFLKAIPGEKEIYGYGDHESDLPFLNLCDHPVLIVSGGGIASRPDWQRGLAILQVETSSGEVVGQ